MTARRSGPACSNEQPDGRSLSAPTFVDAFAGCGGLSLGLMRAGWRGILAIERDPSAFATLSSNLPVGDGPLSYRWPETIPHRAWEINDLLSRHRIALQSLAGRIDLLAGGPPCQGFSYIGRRCPDDPRNFLFEAYLDLVELLRPRFLLLENVLGFQSDFRVPARAGVINFARELHLQLSRNYHVETAILRAEDFGIPQSRARYFFVCATKQTQSQEDIATFFGDLRFAAKAFLTERNLGLSPTAQDAIGDLEVVRNGLVPSPDTPGFRAIGYKGPLSRYQRVMRDGHTGAPPDMRLARHRPRIRERLAAIIKTVRDTNRTAWTLSPAIRRAYKLRKTTIRVLDRSRPSPTITSLPDDLIHYSEPRILTVRENARLQSFPDWFAFQGNFTTGGAARRHSVPRFTQVANAVPPMLAQQLGLNLLSLHRRQLVRGSPSQPDTAAPTPPDVF